MFYENVAQSGVHSLGESPMKPLGTVRFKVVNSHSFTPFLTVLGGLFLFPFSLFDRHSPKDWGGGGANGTLMSER